MQTHRFVIGFESHGDAEAELIPFGDIHFGHANCDLDLMQKTRDYIQSDPRRLWLGMGDYCDAITAKDKRFDPHSVDQNYPTPDVQYRAIKDLFYPIRGQCLGLLDGNHDYSHWLFHNHNYVDQLAYELDVKYLTIDAYIRLVFQRNSGKQPKQNQFNIYAHHGYTSARTSGAKVNRIQDLAQIFPNMNLYLMGHVHLSREAPPQTQLYADQKMNIIHHEERFVFTGSYLRGFMPGAASYVEARGYTPTSLGSPVIKIQVNDKAAPPKSPFTITLGEVSQ